MLKKEQDIASLKYTILFGINANNFISVSRQFTVRHLVPLQHGKIIDAFTYKNAD